ncbi:MAG: YCF48-related protein [Candidatus Paceibacterota bacterium]|jgi:photosystem II stability/assembly factor-like uncharacterized protein
MTTKIKKISLAATLVFMTIYFTGCINLTKKETAPERVINSDQGVFKSVDGGKTWEHKVNVEGGDFLDSIVITGMKLDPKDSKIMYVSTESNGLYKTENGADSWIKIIDESNVLGPDATVNDIAIEKNNNKIIYLAATNNGRGVVLKSEDGGKNWQEKYITDENNKTVHTVEIDPASPNVVYIGTAQGGLIKSSNRGLNWETVKWFDVGTEVMDILIDYNNNNGIVLKTSLGIIKSTDKGKTWEDLGIKISEDVPEVVVANINYITLHPYNPIIIYFTYLNLVVVSKDGGNNWEKLNTITPAQTAIGTAPQVKKIGLIGDKIYYGAGNALYKSDDAGKTWSSYAIAIKGDVRYTESDYTNPDVTYVGSFYTPPPPPKRQRNALFNF